MASKTVKKPLKTGSDGAPVTRSVFHSAVFRPARTEMKWSNVTADEPCPICGKPDWCSVSADGHCICCRREANGGEEKVDKSGGVFWVHYLDTPIARAAPRPAPASTLAVTRAGDETLDRVYRDLQGLLVLSEAHRQALRSRGLSDHEIDIRGYRTLPLAGRTNIAAELVHTHGDDVCKTIPGLYSKTAESGGDYWTLAGSPGILIPVRTRSGLVVSWKIRRDDAAEGSRYLAFSSNRHGGPGSRARVHVPLHERMDTRRVRITEGELKADVATVLDPSRILTISIPGVGSWRLCFPILEEMRAKVLVLAFDADARTNKHVARALASLAKEARSRGYKLEMNKWRQ